MKFTELKLKMTRFLKNHRGSLKEEEEEEDKAKKHCLYTQSFFSFSSQAGLTSFFRGLEIPLNHMILYGG